MALRISTALSNAILGVGRATVNAMMVANTISFDNSSSSILDSGSGLLTAGFLAGDVVRVEGSSNNDTEFTVTSAAAGALVTSVAPTTESAGSTIALAAAQGVTCGGVRDLLRNGVLRIYSGTQPTTPDNAVAGTLLLEVTVDGGAFVAGQAANGLNLGNAASRVVAKATAETWKATGLATGTAGWFRWLGNNSSDSGQADSSYAFMRIDGTVGTSGADLLLVSTAIVTDDIYYINSASLTMPMQYGL